MLSNKEKRFLRKVAVEKDALKFNIGKEILNKNVLKNLDNALEKHEIIKISLLKNSFSDNDDKNTIILDLVSNLKVEIVEQKGNTLLVYRPNLKLKGHIVLPK